MKENVNPFQRFQALGYRHIIPITPPGCPLSERSSLYKRLHANKPRDERGKVPGKCYDGLWSSFPWQKDVEVEAEAWHRMGAGLGVKLGPVFDGEGQLPGFLIALDADTYDIEHAKIVKAIVDRRIGPLPMRIGRKPKALYLFRTDEGFRHPPIVFGDADEKGFQPSRVEFLTKGKQFVAHGTHPFTMKPYEWVRPLVPAKDLPFVSGDELRSIADEIKAALPNAKDFQDRAPSDAKPVPPEQRRAALPTVQYVIASLPNTSEFFPDRDSYIRVMYAIRGALPDHPDEAFELFEHWCYKWAEDENAPDTVYKDWNGVTDEPRIGFPTLLTELRRCGLGPEADKAFAWENFDADAAATAPETPPASSESLPNLFEVLTIDQLFDLPDPEFLIDRHLPEKSVGFLYGDPGTGKSFIALDWALHVAFDRPDWFGDEIQHKQDGCVIYIAGEGASGFKTRVSAWLHRRGIPAGEKGRFGLIQQSVNFMDKDDVMRLVATLRQVVRSPVSMIVIDTVSRAMPGADENLQKEMTLFVKACDVVRDKFNCAVLGVHHAGKSGDMRGSTVLRGAGDYVFKLERKRGASVGRLHCEKQKDAPDGWSDAYRFDVVTLGEDRSSLVPERCDEQSAAGAELTPAVAQSVLEAMQAAWAAGEPWGRTYHAGDRMAARRMVRDFGFEMEQAENVLSIWLGSGAVVEEVFSAKSKRKGLRVADITSATGAELGVENGASAFD